MIDHHDNSHEASAPLASTYYDAAPVITVDPARVLRAGRRRRNATRIGSALGAALAVVAIAVVVIPGVNRNAPASSPPREPQHAVSIDVTPAVVSPGDTVIVSYVGTGSDIVAFGFEIGLEQWDGDEWQPWGYARPCFSEHPCIGWVGQDWPGVGLTIAMPVYPGEVGPSGTLSTEGLEDGWYRLVQSREHGEAITAAGVFEVRTGAAATPPLPDRSDAWLTVSPVLVPPDGGPIVLTTQVASDASGRRSQEDMVEVDDALDLDVTIERWDGSQWVTVTWMSLEARDPDVGVESGSPASLPPLEEGSYRVVRERDAGEPVWGVFTVTPAAPALH